jgi:uncharacterized membrane protein
VALGLFVYTVTGLVAYSYGRLHDRAEYRRAGFLLLAAVVLRLGLVDVWTMDLFWRIITFMVIGALFIATALFERQRDGSDTSESM